MSVAAAATSRALVGEMTNDEALLALIRGDNSAGGNLQYA